MTRASEYELGAMRRLMDTTRHHPESVLDHPTRYLRLQALFVYFGYAVAMVRLQEEQIAKMGPPPHQTTFASHDEYGDCLNKIYTAAIGAYGHLRTCLDFAKGLAEEGLDNDALVKYRKTHRAWAKELIDKRDRVAAHPAETKKLVWKPNMWAGDGRVGFSVMSTNKAQSIVLHPRADLERLRAYLTDLVPHLANTWNIALG